MKPSLGMGCLLAGLMLVPTMAFADEGDLEPLPSSAGTAAKTTESASATEDTVHLRSGGMFRGRVIEIVPGDHVTVVVSTGDTRETRRLAWAEVDRVIVASTTLPPPPPVAANAPMVGPRAHVHIKSSGHTSLFRRPAGTNDLVRACDAPCDMELPLGDTYKIAGSGLSTTHEFRLQASPGGSVDIAVDPPSWVGIVGGGLLTISGGFTAYIGAIFALAGSAGDSGSSCSSCTEGKEVRNAGFGLLAAGAAMIGVGLAIVYPSMKTDLSQEASSPPRAPARDAFVRRPVWNTGAAKVETFASPATFPALFERRF